MCFEFVVLKQGAEDPSWEARYENVLHRRVLLPASGCVMLEVDGEAF